MRLLSQPSCYIDEITNCFDDKGKKSVLGIYCIIFNNYSAKSRGISSGRPRGRRTSWLNSWNIPQDGAG